MNTRRLTREALSSASSSTSSSSDLRSSSSSSSLSTGGSSSTILDFLRDVPFALPLDCRLADMTPTRIAKQRRPCAVVRRARKRLAGGHDVRGSFLSSGGRRER